MKIAIDCSYYNVYSPLQYDILASGIDGAIVRTSFGLNQDKMHKKHLEEFRNRGVAVAGYHWVDVTVDKVRQVEFILEMTKVNLLPSMMQDQEQYWRDWAAFMRQDLTEAYRTRFTPEQLFSYYNYVNKGVKTGLNNKGIESWIYSASWFIDRYCPRINEILDSNYCEARYLRYYNPAGLATVYKQFGKPITFDKISEFIPHAPIVRGNARQWESLVYVNGLYEKQDYIFITDEGFNKMFQMDAPVEPTPPVIPPVVTKTYIVNTWSLNIRSGAGVNYSWVGYYLKGAKVSVFEISGDWGKTEKGWINLNYTLPIQGSYKVNTVWLNVRAYAFATSAIVGGLKFGDIVYELDRSGVWINIGKGWVNSTYLKPV
jgi:hypothetical protein